VLRAALSKAAAERRSELKTQPELVSKPAKQIERRLIRMLMEADGFRRELAAQLQSDRLYLGLETERIFGAVIVSALSEQPLPATEIGASLEERDRRLFFEILFEEAHEGTWEEAESCLEALRGKQVDRELAQVQREIEGNPTGAAMRELLVRKQALLKRKAVG
jgi:hypothetical protein